MTKQKTHKQQTNTQRKINGFLSSPEVEVQERMRRRGEKKVEQSQRQAAATQLWVL